MSFFKKRAEPQREINEMRTSERENLILTLEADRERVVEDIEKVMAQIAKETKQRRLKRRKKRR